MYVTQKLIIKQTNKIEITQCAGYQTAIRRGNSEFDMTESRVKISQF
jgi:hypothetical protein